MKENSWFIEYQKFEVCRSLATAQHRKTWSEVIRRNLDKWKVSKEFVKDRSA